MFLRRPYLPETVRCSTKQWKIIRSASSNQHLVISQPRQQWLSFPLQCFVTFSWACHCLWKVVCRRVRSNVNGSYEIEFKGRGKKQNGVRGDKQLGVGNTGNCSQSPLLPAQHSYWVDLWNQGHSPSGRKQRTESCPQVLWPLADKYWRIFQS